MTRAMFFATLVAAIAMAVTALMIRYELAAPGVSPLFSNADGMPNGRLFNLMPTFHGLFCLFSVTLLGTTMTSAARDKGAKYTAPVIAIGVAIAGLMGLALVLWVLPFSPSGPPPGEGVGWVLYPPISSPPSVLDRLLAALSLPPALFFPTTRLLLLPATALLYFGAFALLSTRPKTGWALPLGALTCIAVTGAVSPTIMTASLRDMSTTLIFLPAILFACIALRMFTQRPPWLVMLFLGNGAILAAYFAITDIYDTPYLSDTMAAAAIMYVVPLGLAWFALPALILFARNTDQYAITAWLTPFVITASLATWIVPLLMLGRMGMPMRYMDYPEAFSDLNAIASRAVFSFVLLYLVILARSRGKQA